MTRFLQAAIVIIAAALCSCLSACQSPPPSRVIDGRDLEITLQSMLPDLGDRIHLEDHAYLSVTQSELWAAINAGWKPHTGKEAGDCDDQAADILYQLRRTFRGRSNGPAAGRVTGIIRGAPHCAVWYAGLSGQIRLFDPTSLVPLHPILIEPERAFDK